MTPCSTKGCNGTTDRIHGQCDECVSAFARRSRLEQGLSETITDPVVLDALAASVLAVATPAVSLPPPATDRDAAGIGAAGHNVATGGGGCGEVAPPPATRAVGTAGRSNSL